MAQQGNHKKDDAKKEPKRAQATPKKQPAREEKPKK
ncbi:hypothetical protein SAMN05878281_1815 [Salegentibacter salegens]|uniref:Uncharacterized protein n=1 Tax=Salegentibacter salegens TaxID=143223 RepID=A0A1M7L9C1_9FLAO|nr:hypothetical protein SAMN05878281_1815 [Salegentibacter salegens]